MKKIFIFAFLFLLKIGDAADLKIETLDEQKGTDNLLVLRLRVTNNTGHTLKKVRVRYYFKKAEQKSIALEHYYTEQAQLSIENLDSVNSCLNIDLDSLPSGLYPNESGLSIGLHYSDWSAWNKADDFSDPESSVYKENEKTSLYMDGTLIWGLTPSLVSDAPVELRFYGIQLEASTQCGPWFELKNFGLKSIPLDSVFLHDGKGDRFNISHEKIKSGERIRIYLDSLSPAKTFDLQGELLLEYGSNPIDYIVWGKAGKYAEYAVENGLWQSATDYLQILDDSRVGSLSLPYISGSFFRNMNKEIRSSESWLLYSGSELAESDSSLPNSAPLSWPSMTQVVLKQKEPLHFVWIPIPGAERYRLTVLSKDSSIVYQGEVAEKNFANVNLDSGTYFWAVQASDQDKPFSKKPTLFYQIRKILESSYITEKSLGVVSSPAKKDTKLLAVNWGEFADLREWDKTHESHTDPDEEEGSRCWAVAIYMFNHYYGGNLTQNEIVMHEKMKENPILDVFRLYEGGSPDQIADGISWALNITKPSWTEGRPSASILKRQILTGFPICIIIYTDPNHAIRHALLIDGYRETIAGQLQVHLLNTDNYGTSEWRIYDDNISIVRYLTIGSPTSARNTDPSVHTDSDGDGIMDYDEVVRFKTDPNKKDSDGDGIDDKTEIHSYTIREISDVRKTKMESSTAPILWMSIVGISKETLADVDNDGLRAELDSDSDDDGVPDGEEDKNHNGIVDAGETDPYVADNFLKDDKEKIPWTLGLYSLSFLWINDGVICIDDRKGCSVAAEGASNEYAVIIGSGASLNNIYTEKQVWVRNRADVGFIRYYGLPLSQYTTTKQAGATTLGEFNELTSLWPWSIQKDLKNFSAGSSEITVQAGETYTLADGIHLKKLKVEPGGRLLISTGEMFVAELQLEANAELFFSQPGYRSILHVDGPIIWHAQITKDADLKTISRGFRLIYHGNAPVYIEGSWAGSLFAPNARLILGQAGNKVLYGEFLADGIAVHQYTTIHKISFDPIEPMNVVLK
jgi:hypothetical protein